jgi:hypothetical protein
MLHKICPSYPTYCFNSSKSLSLNTATLLSDSDTRAGGVPGGVHDDGLDPLLALVDEPETKAGGEQGGVLGDE